MLFKRAPRMNAPAQPARPADSLRDELGLHQLWYFERRLHDEVARASRSQRVFSLAAWRLHLLPGEQPDAVTVERAAELITAHLRSYDIAARVDDCRFIALVFDADQRNIGTVGFRIKGDLQSRVQTLGRWKAGVASFGRDGLDADALLQASLNRLEEDSLG
jgi:hypothetical protein